MNGLSPKSVPQPLQKIDKSIVIDMVLAEFCDSDPFASASFFTLHWCSGGNSGQLVTTVLIARDGVKHVGQHEEEALCRPVSVLSVKTDYSEKLCGTFHWG